MWPVNFSPQAGQTPLMIHMSTRQNVTSSNSKCNYTNNIQTKHNLERVNPFQRSITYLLLHIALTGSDGSGEQPGQAIELSSLDSGRPNPRVFVAKEDMALVELYGTSEKAFAEARARESELGVDDRIGGGEGKEAVVLEASRGASGRF